MIFKSINFAPLGASYVVGDIERQSGINNLFNSLSEVLKRKISLSIVQTLNFDFLNFEIYTTNW